MYEASPEHWHLFKYPPGTLRSSVLHTQRFQSNIHMHADISSLLPRILIIFKAKLMLETPGEWSCSCGSCLMGPLAFPTSAEKCCKWWFCRVSRDFSSVELKIVVHVEHPRNKMCRRWDSLLTLPSLLYKLLSAFQGALNNQSNYYHSHFSINKTFIHLFFNSHKYSLSLSLPLCHLGLW